jgi:hypothetical protein
LRRPCHTCERPEGYLAIVSHSQADRLWVEIHGQTLRVRLDVEHLGDPSADDVARADVAGKRGAVHPSIAHLQASASGVNERVHLGMHDSTKFDQVTYTGMLEQLHLRGFVHELCRESAVSGFRKPSSIL